MYVRMRNPYIAPVSIQQPSCQNLWSNTCVYIYIYMYTCMCIYITYIWSYIYINHIYIYAYMWSYDVYTQNSSSMHTLYECICIVFILPIEISGRHACSRSSSSCSLRPTGRRSAVGGGSYLPLNCFEKIYYICLLMFFQGCFFWFLYWCWFIDVCWCSQQQILLVTMGIVHTLYTLQSRSFMVTTVHLSPGMSWIAMIIAHSRRDSQYRHSRWCAVTHDNLHLLLSGMLKNLKSKVILHYFLG